MSFYSPSELLRKIFEEIESKYEKHEARRSGKPAPPIPTGFKKLDELTGGLRQGTVMLISGFSGYGKSALSHNIAERISVKKNIPVAIFSLEIRKEELITRMLSSIAGVSLKKLHTGGLEGFMWGRLSEAVGVLYEAPLYIDDSEEYAMEDVKSAFKRLADEKLVRLVIIDSLDGLAERAKDENLSSGKVLLSLKELAVTYQIPVIATLGLQCAIRRGKPTLSDVRAAGVSEDDADVVIFIDRDTDKDIFSLEDQTAEIIIPKNKDLPQGTATLTFVPAFARFTQK